MEELELEVQRLGQLVYDEHIKAEVESVIAKVPAPESLTTADQKIRAYLLRARAKLLLPVFSKEAEQDINKALKLNQNAPQTWVALSEAYWRRNALQEAKDALDSALRIDAKCQTALAQYSRILRSMCSLPDIPNEQKLAYLTESEAKAREAVGVNPNDGESWAVLGVALLQQAVANGMELNLLKKTLAALNQAAAKAPSNPDVHYNRGVVHATFGHFGAAVQDFSKAYELDPKGLKGAKLNAEQNVQILLKSRSKIMAGYGGMTERDFKKNIAAKLPAKGVDGNQKFVQLNDVLDKVIARDVKTVDWVAVKVLDLLSGPTDQPLVYLVADKDGTSCLLLMYRVSNAAVKIGDTIMIPFPPSSAATLGHTYEDVAALDIKADRFTTPTMVVEPNTLIVNGSPISAKFYKMPQIGTRQFQ